MAKYLMLWTSDTSKYPDDPKESIPLMMKLQDMIKQGLKEGKLTDLGIFLDGNGGYAIGEGSGVDVIKGAFQYMPYITANVQEVLSVEEVAEVTKSLMG